MFELRNSGENLLEIDSHPVQAIDTVGAGDMYAGAFLYGITHGMGYKGAGNLASLAAARVVSTFGARLQTAKEQEGKHHPARHQRTIASI